MCLCSLSEVSIATAVIQTVCMVDAYLSSDQTTVQLQALKRHVHTMQQAKVMQLLLIHVCISAHQQVDVLLPEPQLQGPDLLLTPACPGASRYQALICLHAPPLHQ